MKLPFHGGCACKAIRYECRAEPLAMGHCHCRDCQYVSGNAFSTVLEVPASAVTISGKPKFYETLSSKGTMSRRAFCSNCWSPIFGTNESHKEFIGIKVATVDDSSWFQPSIDIWLSDAQPWDQLSPDTQKFSGDME